MPSRSTLGPKNLKVAGTYLNTTKAPVYEREVTPSRR